jgi:glycosyl transferase family 1
MRVVFHNPHRLWYKMTLGNFIDQKKPVVKYEYLLDYVYHRDEKVHVCLDPVAGGAYARLRMLTKFYIWVLINKLSPRRFKITTGVEKLKEGDVLLSFIFGNLSNLNGRFDLPAKSFIQRLERTKAFKVMNLSHFGYHAGLGSSNARAARIDLLVSENNLSRNSDFFQKYYAWYDRDVYVLPFVPQERFVRRTAFDDRENKALAIGTITFPMVDPDFVSFFEDDRLQPMRHEIFNNSDQVKDTIESYISHLGKEGGAKKVQDRKENGADHLNAQLYKALLRSIDVLSASFRFMMSALGGKPTPSLGDKEREYYKSDVVKHYNDYRMFVCPEEVIGVPGIGFVEGMACGSAYLGIRDPMYSDLGMVDGVHYIGYDGTLEDLQRQIEHYQRNSVELEEVAEQGRRFVAEMMTAEVVCGKFFADLEKLLVESPQPRLEPTARRE